MQHAFSSRRNVFNANQTVDEIDTLRIKQTSQHNMATKRVYEFTENG